MWFVLSKYHEIRKFEKPGAINVLDQAVLNVRAYTNLLFKNEDRAAMHIINDCFDYMESQTGAPDLLVNLKCSPAEQMRRIRGRGRDHEKGVTLEYITELQTEINRLVAMAKADGHAVMNIDTEAVYLPDNAEYAHRLARQIADMFHLDLPAAEEAPAAVAYARKAAVGAA
jgi:deoxyadenosine/deoxycytidine kinase